MTSAPLSLGSAGKNSGSINRFPPRTKVAIGDGGEVSVRRIAAAKRRAVLKSLANFVDDQFFAANPETGLEARSRQRRMPASKPSLGRAMNRLVIFADARHRAGSSVPVLNFSNDGLPRPLAKGLLYSDLDGDLDGDER